MFFGNLFHRPAQPSAPTPNTATASVQGVAPQGQPAPMGLTAAPGYGATPQGGAGQAQPLGGLSAAPGYGSAPQGGAGQAQPSAPQTGFASPMGFASVGQPMLGNMASMLNPMRAAPSAPNFGGAMPAPGFAAAPQAEAPGSGYAPSMSLFSRLQGAF